MAIEQKGFSVVSEEEYYRTIIDELKKDFPNMSESPSNLLVILARILARNENMRDYDRVEAYSNAYVATATEQHLSKAVRTAGISRLLGTSAVGKVLITKSDDEPQVILPAQTELKCNNITYVTINTSAVIINSSSREIEIVSKEVGSEMNTPNGSKFTTVLNIKGVKDVVATTDISGGTDVESDADLRVRYFRRMSAYSNSSLKGIIDRVLSVPEVTICNGDENNTPNIVNGLMPHSFIIYANGGTEQAIAEAIMASKPAGIQTNGEIEKEVMIGDRSFPIRFSRFAENAVYYKVEIVIDRAMASPTIAEDVKQQIVDFTKANTSIINYELSTEISQAFDEIKGVKSLKFGLTPDPQISDDLVADIGRVFFTDIENIEVVVI